ncbi:hypothetical protein [Cnuella takakiae]|nr:hypothetical protein [Cnuella takakiae]
MKKKKRYRRQEARTIKTANKAATNPLNDIDLVENPAWRQVFFTGF